MYAVIPKTTPIIIVLLLFYLCSFSQSIVVNGIQQINAPIKGKIILEPFQYQSVHLSGGRLKQQLDEVKTYYLNINNNDLLRGFRLRKGLPTQGGKELGGWYSADIFHVFGQILSGLSRLYAVTGDAACRDKVKLLIDEWAKCNNAEGYFFYSNNPNARHYVYDKMVGGLVDAYVFTGNTAALTHLNTITDWAITNLDRTRPYSNTATEWYTLTENLYRAYLATNNKKYLDFGQVWEYTTYWDLYKDNKNIFSKTGYYHAYSHLNTLSGAAAAYLVKGDAGYKATVASSYDYFRNEQCFATGGFGPNEALQSSKTRLTNTLYNSTNTFETQCGSWAGFKLSKYLLMFTGDGKYGDWIERLVINGIGASIPMTSNGRVMYYSNYNAREGTKVNYGAGWACCTGTRPQAVAEYADLVYFKNAAGLYVNLYTPADVEWNGMTVSQHTHYPESNTADFSIKITGQPQAAKAIFFRKPAWLKQQPQIMVNGLAVTAVLENNWYKVEKEWKDGDKIKVTFAMGMEISKVNPAKPYPVAVSYGPVVLAATTNNMPYPDTLLKMPLQSFNPVAGKPLNYTVKDMPGFTIKPFYAFAADEPYAVYIEPAVKFRLPNRKIQTTGTWHSSDQFYCNQIGATVTATFNSTGVRLLAYKYLDAGKFSVEMDGNQVEIVDQYGPGYAIPFQKEYTGLGNGTHTIRLTVLNDKNPASKGNYINYIAFETIRAAQKITAKYTPALEAGSIIPVTLTASSGLPVMLSSSNPAVASVSGHTVTLHKPGIVTVTASQYGDENYYPAPSLSQTFTVIPAKMNSITVRQAVSPNGDGVNDFLQIDGIEQYPGNKVAVVASNGAKVFETEGYNNASRAFNGLSNINGRKVQPGTYFYLLEYKDKGKVESKKGYFILKY